MNIHDLTAHQIIRLVAQRPFLPITERELNGPFQGASPDTLISYGGDDLVILIGGGPDDAGPRVSVIQNPKDDGLDLNSGLHQVDLPLTHGADLAPVIIC